MGLISSLKKLFGRGPQPVSNQVTETALPSDSEVIQRLFRKHIPEIADGVVEIKAIARIDGARTKIAVYSPNAQLDAVRLCVGADYARIKSIVDELGGERIDILRWHESLDVMIANAMAPAKIEQVFLYSCLGRAIVLVKQDQLPMAIGEQGQNVRLAAKLVHWDIEIMTSEELKEVTERALKWFGQLPHATDKKTKALIEQGFLSYDDLTFVTPTQLAEVTEVTEEQASAIILFAEKEATRLEKEQRSAEEKS